METDATKAKADENEGNPCEKPEENVSYVSTLGEDGEWGRNLDGYRDGNENEEDGGEEVVGDEEHEYFVGDLVWGKIKGYPWWPGQIYHPSDASESARKYDQRERLLVAYFDGSYSWCRRSQLKPFSEDFEEMSKQSDSKSFLNSLQKAVEGIGWLVESKLTCSCVSGENRLGLGRPCAENAGIREGVLVPEPEGGPRRVSIPRHGPARVVATVKYIAEVGCSIGMLELTVLTSFLSAFYRAKGWHRLAVYQGLEELEDENRNCESDGFDFSSLGKEVKEGRVLGDFGSVETDQLLLQRCHRGKKKSVANGKRKRRCSRFASPLGRKRGRKEEAELSWSPKSAENEVLSAKDGSCGGVEEEEEEIEQDKVSSIENGDKFAEERTPILWATRGKKQRKYLPRSPANLKWVLRSLGSEAESVKIAELLGEQMIRVVDQLIGSPPITKCSGETFQEKLPIELSWSPKSAENEVLSAKHGSCGGVEEEEDKQDKVSSIDNGEEEEEEEDKQDKVSSIDNGDLPLIMVMEEEIKQDKVSSIDNGDLALIMVMEEEEIQQDKVSSIDNGDKFAESVKMAKPLGEQMIRVVDQLNGSPPITKCSGETFQEKLPIEFDNPRSLHPREEWKKMIDSMEINASTEDVVSQQRSAAQNPFYFRENYSVDLVERFISAFRSALFLQGSNYKRYHRKCRSCGKRF